jgi:hypothetical protein
MHVFFHLFLIFMTCVFFFSTLITALKIDNVLLLTHINPLMRAMRRKYREQIDLENVSPEV